MSRRTQLDDIDYDTILQCTSTRRLREMIKILEKESFPDLLLHARKRLQEIETGGKAATPMTAEDDGADSLDNTIKELYQWALHQNKPVQLNLALDTAREEKKLGNAYFQKGDMENALLHYSRSIEAVPDAPETATVYSNRAQVLLKLSRFAEAEKDATAALNFTKDDVKALWRRGVARHNLKQYTEALADFDHALAFSPGNVEITRARAKTEALAPRANVKSASTKPEVVSSSQKSEPATKSASQVDGPPPTKFRRIPIQEVDEEPAESAKQQSSASIMTPNTSVPPVVRHAPPASPPPVPAPLRPSLPPDLEEIKNDGLKLFSQGKFIEAIEAFTKVFDASAKLPDMAEVRAACLDNRAQCHMQLSHHKNAVEDSSAALALLQSMTPNASTSSALPAPTPVPSPSIVPMIVKNLMRRAFAYDSLENFNAAVRDLEEAQSLDRQNLKVVQALQRISGSARRYNALQCEEEKKKGNKYFEAQDFEVAIEAYARGLHYCGVDRKVLIDTTTSASGGRLQRSASQSKGIEDLAIPIQVQVRDPLVISALLTNRALAYLRIKNFTAAVDDCTVALDREPGNTKALFRRGLANKALATAAEPVDMPLLFTAYQDIAEAVRLDPKDAVQVELDKIKQLIPADQLQGAESKSSQQTPVHNTTALAEPAQAKSSSSFLIANLLDFERALKTRPSDPNLPLQLLQSATPSVRCDILHSNALEPEAFESIVKSIAHHDFSVDAKIAMECLDLLISSSRFQINAAFLPDSVKQTLRKGVEQGRKSGAAESVVRNVLKAFS